MQKLLLLYQGPATPPDASQAVIYPKKLATSQKMCHVAKRFQRMGFLS